MGDTPLPIRSSAGLVLAGTWAGLLSACAAAQDALPQESARPVELGAVTWHRDFAGAETLAARRGLPLLALFQEVPG